MHVVSTAIVNKLAIHVTNMFAQPKHFQTFPFFTVSPSFGYHLPIYLKVTKILGNVVSTLR